MDKEYANYLLNKIKNDYNLISEDFSSTRTAIWPELSFLFKDIKVKEKILDLGCGNGRLYKLLEKTNYTGIDISERLISIAKKKYPRVNFKVANALNLSFKKELFDKVYSIAVLHHIPSKKLRIQFLKEIKKVLKKDGSLILTVWKKTYNLLLLRYTFLKIIGKSQLDFKDTLEPWADKTERYYHWFSQKELADLIKETGFKIKDIGVIKNKKGNRQNIYIIASKRP